MYYKYIFLLIWCWFGLCCHAHCIVCWWCSHGWLAWPLSLAYGIAEQTTTASPGYMFIHVH